MCFVLTHSGAAKNEVRRNINYTMSSLKRFSLANVHYINYTDCFAKMLQENTLDRVPQGGTALFRAISLHQPHSG